MRIVLTITMLFISQTAFASTSCDCPCDTYDAYIKDCVPGGSGNNYPPAKPPGMVGSYAGMGRCDLSATGVYKYAVFTTGCTAPYTEAHEQLLEEFEKLDGM